MDQALSHEPTHTALDARLSETDGLTDKTLLILDDDKAFWPQACTAMEARGFEVTAASSVSEGLAAIAVMAPAFAVIDMRLADGNGLDVISSSRRGAPDTRAVVLTGYGNIVTAVTAVKLGAFDYLAKPADADEIFNALMANQHDKAALPENPMSADRVGGSTSNASTNSADVTCRDCAPS